MIRRNARLRSEYIYRKSLEGKEKQMYEHKRAVQKAMDEGKPIPTELKRESDKIMNEIDLDDERTKRKSIM